MLTDLVSKNWRCKSLLVLYALTEATLCRFSEAIPAIDKALVSAPRDALLYHLK